jgi:hypothetical protein
VTDRGKRCDELSKTGDGFSHPPLWVLFASSMGPLWVLGIRGPKEEESTWHRAPPKNQTCRPSLLTKRHCFIISSFFPNQAILKMHKSVRIQLLLASSLSIAYQLGHPLIGFLHCFIYSGQGALVCRISFHSPDSSLLILSCTSSAPSEPS